MIKIDKKVPMPAITNRGRPAKYPWAEMKVGDSFFLKLSKAASVNSMIYSAGKKHCVRFSARKEGAGYRIWRTE